MPGADGSPGGYQLQHPPQPCWFRRTPKKDNSTKYPTAYQARNVGFLQLWRVISAVWVYSVSF